MATKPKPRGAFEMAEEDADPQALKKAKGYARECILAQQRVDALAAEGELLTKRIFFLKTNAIPEALKRAGISSFTDAETGQEVELDDNIWGTLPKEEEARAKALALIEKYGGASLIRTLVIASFTKEEHDEATKLYKELRKRNDLNLEMKNDIHHQTFLAFLRERKEEGKSLDARTLGVTIGSTTKFKTPKAKRRKE